MIPATFLLTISFFKANNNIVDIENPDGTYSLTFVVDDFSGLFLHPSFYSIIQLRSAKIMNGSLSHF